MRISALPKEHAAFFGFTLIHLLSSSNITVIPLAARGNFVSGRERSSLRMSLLVDQEFQEHERSATCVAQRFRTLRQQQMAFQTFFCRFFLAAIFRVIMNFQVQIAGLSNSNILRWKCCFIDFGCAMWGSKQRLQEVITKYPQLSNIPIGDFYKVLVYFSCVFC